MARRPELTRDEKAEMEGTGAYLKRDEEEADPFSFFHCISMERKGFLYKGRNCRRMGFPIGVWELQNPSFKENQGQKG